MVARVIPVECFDLVIFGATGDSGPAQNPCRASIGAGKKGKFPKGAPLWVRRAAELDADSFRDLVRSTLEEFLPAEEVLPDIVASFLDMPGLCHHRCTAADTWLARIGRADAGWPKCGRSISRSHRPCFGRTYRPNA